MALPKMGGTIYNTVIPSSNTPIKFKPFTVRQQKALMIAQQSEDLTVMADTLKNVIHECVVEDIDVDRLAIFDIEYLFLQLRSKSVGETVELFFACDDCGTQTKIAFDLSAVKVTTPEGHTNRIDLGDNIGIIFKYPGIDMLKYLDNIDMNDVDAVFGIIVSCVDSIYDEEQIHYAKEQTREELESFLDSLSTQQFAKVQAFFETMPRMQQQVVFTCPKCGLGYNKSLSGINNFF